jgi:adenylate cyclase class IV
MKELTARCGGFAEIEQRLRKMEAQKVGEGKEIANYFDTEGRGGLKIVQEEKGGRMVFGSYDEETGCFDIVSTPVGDLNGVRRIFTKLFSSTAQVSMESKAYQVGRVEVFLAHMDRLGNFVIIMGEDAENLHEILGKLGIEPDKIVKETFGELLTGKGKKLG